MTSDFQGKSLPSLLSIRLEFLKTYLVRVPITLKEQVTLKIQHETLWSAGAQDMDTKRYQVSELRDVKFHWKDPDLNIVAVFRPCKFCFNFQRLLDAFIGRKLHVFRRWSRKENATSNSSLWDTLPNPCVAANHPFGASIGNILKNFTGCFLDKYYCVCILTRNLIKTFHFIVILFKNHSNICETKNL